MLSILLPGYQLSSPIYESVNSLVYQGQRERDGLPVILKILKSDRATATEIARYHQEYHITQQLDLDGVVRALALETYQNTLAIVLEDFGGLSLKQYLAQRPSHRLRLPEFLDLAIQIVEILGQIHGANVIHKDINPANLLYNPELNCVKVIDFGISSQVTPPYTVLPNPSILEGTLPYMSPEQTGRMNCSLDYRSDFYSLGVTFYELLLGRLPFESTDTMELVHCHIAQNPPPPHEIDPSIPEALSGILLKLLAKTADERYQSAWGIQTDLVLCLMQLEATGTIEDVTPGENDVVNKFRIPQTIYGRDRQLEQLHRAFEVIGAVPQSEPGASPAVNRTGSTSAIFIMGESGIGKTALVAESYKPLTRHCGYFVSGTFERSRSESSSAGAEGRGAGERPSARTRAYRGWISALSELIRQLLTETETSLGRWRDRLLQALLREGQANEDDNADFANLLALIPELQLVLGPNLPPTLQRQERRLGNHPTCPPERLQQLLQVFAHSRDPFVVFLDNLQWADLDSLALIETLLSDPKSQSFLIIAAYRDNQTRLLRQPLAHPPTSPSPFALNSILSLQERLGEIGCPVGQIHLQGLELEAIAALVTDTLQNSLKTVMPLAALISQKTNGNPFFVREFLKTLDREQLLRFDDESMSWQWDIERIRALDITDNVLEFLLDQFKTLPPRTQYLLHLGSVVGMEFDLDLIADLVNGSPEQLFQNLIPALVEGLVQPQAKDSSLGEPLSLSAVRSSDPQEILLLRQYQFLHEQVQQAAYRMTQTAPLANREGAPKISTDTAKLHLQIGQRLLQRAQHPPMTRSLSSPESPEMAEAAITDRDIFEIVYHWNLGQGAIAETQESIQRAQLNHLAAQQARLMGDYTAAIAYSLAGIDALGPTAWSATPQLSFNLHLERARANFLQGNLDRSQDLLKILYQQQPQEGNQGSQEGNQGSQEGNQGSQEGNHKGSQEGNHKGLPLRTELDSLTLACLSLRGEVEAADKLARTTLDRLGLRPELPPLLWASPSQQSSLPHWYPEQLSPSPSEAVSALDQLLGQTLTFYLTYAPQSDCCREIVRRLLLRSQQLGPTAATPLAAAVYSVMLLNQGDKELAQTWAQAVEAWLPHPEGIDTSPGGTAAEGTAQKTDASKGSSRTDFGSGPGQPNPYPAWSDLQLASQIYPRRYGIPKSLSLLDAAERHSRKVGDWLALGVINVERLYLEFYGGKALNILAGDIAQALEWCRKYQHHWAMDALKALQMPLRYLRFGLAAEEILKGVTPGTQLAPSQRRVWACTEIHHAWVLYLERQYELALSRLEGVMTPAIAITPGDVNPLTWGLGRVVMALCWSALTQMGEPLPEPFLTVAAELESWSHDGPENFASLAAMLEGERQRLEGNEGEAIDAYDAAIEQALESHCPYAVTLAHELAAQFWLGRQKPKIARVYLAEAYTAYQRWGARYKVEQLGQTYGSLLSVATLALQNEEDSDSFNRRVNMSLDYTRSRAAVLDVTTVMKAARSLSGEIVLDRLLGKLMKLAIANAGATRGAIILDRMGQLTLEIVQTVGDLDEDSEDESGEGAEDDNRPRTSGLRPGIAIEACESLPRSAIHYVARTNESVVLNDATAESAFVNDLYIQKFQPKSLLCAPIQGKGKLIGLLYLENNLTAGAFTRDRLDVLMLLCAQAAIALENARLYENLKQSELRERDRAQQLRDSLEELQQAQLQLVQSEKMATLGQLVAGVAHEINNPVGFVDANLSHAAGYIEDLLGLLELYQETFPDPGEDIEEEMEEIDLDFILKDLPQILSSMSVGTERIRQISRSLRTFSRADTSSKVAVNIHEGIDSTLMILKPRLKFTQARPAIEVVKEYGDIPEIKCYAGQLNQVFMNIIANAIDAFDEANVGLTFEEIEKHPNRITICTELVERPLALDDEGTEKEPDWVIIRIRDNGPGMPDDVRNNIFNHLFTTKAVGKGTGLGLSISHQIVVEKHQGRLSCLSSPGEGTEFIIEIPID